MLDNNYIKARKILADFVEIKNPNNSKLYNNLFTNENTLIEFLSKIDESWVNATNTESGLFSPEDKRLLKVLVDHYEFNAGRGTIKVSDISTATDIEATQVVIDNSSNLEIENYSSEEMVESILDPNGPKQKVVTNGVKLSVSPKVMGLLKFVNHSQNSSNIEIKYDENREELVIVQKRFEFESTSKKTVFNINHNLGTKHLLTKIYTKNAQNIYVEAHAPVIPIDDNNAKVTFTTAVSCKILLTKF